MKRARRTPRRRRTGLAPQRLTVIALFALTGFGLLAVRAAQLQTIDAERLARIAERQSATRMVIQPKRANILDRNGNLLAISANVQSVAAAPIKINPAQRRQTARELSRVLGIPAREIERRIASRKQFIWIARWVEPEIAEHVQRLGLDGVFLRKERRRYYPNGTLAAAYVGIAGRDGIGLTGLELDFERELRGESASIPASRDARGTRLPHISSSADSGEGEPLRLTLDAKLQHSADKALQRSLKRTGARSGSLVALDPRNGDVLALAQAPTFNPNQFWSENSKNFRVRAIVDPFEPGSTLKPFSIAVALESGMVDARDVFDCENGKWSVLNRTIHDMKPHRVLSVHDILRVSSNIGAAKIANRIGSKELVVGLRRFGFGKRTGSGFPGEASGVLRNLAENQQVERANIAFGQGLAVTALQLAGAGAVIANGGNRVVPRLALREGSDSSHASEDRVISRETAALVLKMMRSVVENGTGKRAALTDHSVAGKTGTAQKVVDGTYSRDRHVASFLGVVPAVNPRLVVVVVLDEPVGAYSGGEVAAPVFREFAGSAVRQLGIPVGGAE